MIPFLLREKIKEMYLKSYLNDQDKKIKLLDKNIKNQRNILLKDTYIKTVATTLTVKQYNLLKDLAKQFNSPMGAMLRGIVEDFLKTYS
jgi:hypothetical protein